MKFCFYCEYKNKMGGHIVLLINLIKGLIEQNQEVVLFNYEDGLIMKELHGVSNKVILINIDTVSSEKVVRFVSNEDILMIHGFYTDYTIFIQSNPKVIYYDIADLISKISDYKYGIKLRFLAKKLLLKLINSHSLAFMDDTGIFSLRTDFGIQVKHPIFLPIPIEVPKENQFVARKQKVRDTIRISYIGRSVDWKMMPLKKIIEDVKHMETNKRIEFNLIVDDTLLLTKFININEYEKDEKLSINVNSNVKPSELSEFLLRNSDLHFSMGTAALEGSKLGIPTILIDFSSKELPSDYTYRWLFETENYSLGKNLAKRSFLSGIKIDYLINTIYSNPQLVNEISNKCYNYTLENHELEKTTSKFIEIAQKARFHLASAKPFVPYYYKFHQLAKRVAKILTF